ncbi:MAG: stage II sporulation protein M [Myxococcota bacterium]
MELRLERLASEAHRLLHKGQASRQSGLLSQLLDFPGAVRRNRAWVLIALGLFYGTTLVGGLLAWFDQVYAEAILGPQQVLLMEDMYGEAAVRSVEANLTMTGFYVFNNVGIAFRCFATGFLLGIGPIFYMVFNGLNLGAVAGHLVRIGAGGNIGAFVVSHAPWELTAIGLAGAAGLQMGWAVIAPGRHTRLGRLRRVGPELMRQVLGIAAFLLVAALIEGLWSATSAPAWVKLSCGIVGAVLVGWILIFSGRRRPLPEDVRDG